MKLFLSNICYNIGCCCAYLSNLQPLGFDMGYIFGAPYQWFMKLSYQLCPENWDNN